jgi:hypothetical protein
MQVLPVRNLLEKTSDIFQKSLLRNSLFKIAAAAVSRSQMEKDCNEFIAARNHQSVQETFHGWRKHYLLLQAHKLLQKR